MGLVSTLSHFLDRVVDVSALAEYVFPGAVRANLDGRIAKKNGKSNLSLTICASSTLGGRVPWEQ